MKNFDKLVELAKNVDVKSNYSINIDNTQKLLLIPTDKGLTISLKIKDNDSSKSKTKILKVLHKFDMVELLRYILETEFTDEPDVDDLVEEIKNEVEQARMYLPKKYKNINPSIDALDQWIDSHYGINHHYYREQYNELLNAVNKVYDIQDCHQNCDPYENYFSYSMLIDYHSGNKIIRNSRHGSLRYIEEHQSELQYLNHWIGKFIPSSGKSKTMAAELISNCHYVLYRWFNDGDSALSYRDANMIPAINILAYIDYKLEFIDKLDFYIELVKTAKDIYGNDHYGPNMDLSKLKDDYVKGVVDKYDIKCNLKSFELSDCVEDPIQTISLVLVTLFRILDHKPEYLREYQTIINLRDTNACEDIMSGAF